MNLSAYNLKDIQSFIALLNQFEAEGISDVRFVRERLSRSLTKRVGTVGRVKKRRTVQPPVPALPDCPSCKVGRIVGPWSIDGLKIVRCSLKCGYSRVVA